jgi:cytochrome c oxidase assembly factor CtaG/cytochrome c2
MHIQSSIREWTVEPGVVTSLVVLGVWYHVGYMRLMVRRRARARIGDRRPRWFGVGMLFLLAALASPLDAVAGDLFSAHMVQHLLLILAAAPAFALAAPAPELWWGLPSPIRPGIAHWVRRPTTRHAWHLLSSPSVVFAMHAIALWFWHFPTPYEAAERQPGVHALEHLSFFATALLFWWVVLQPSGHRRLSYALTIPYVVATMLHEGLLGGLFVYASGAWFPSHIAGAARWGLSPLADQQLAGVIMWIPAGFVYIGVAVRAAYHWIREDERRQRVLISAGTAIAILFIVSCGKASANAPDRYVEGGDADRGHRAIVKYGCGACHMIPGVDQADGMVGPPLIHWRQRTMIAGEIPNVPDRLIMWLQVPQSVEPGTAMPNMGVSKGEARDMAAYLYSIK